jgi:hypothetical protein
MWRTASILMALASFVVGCAQSGTVTLSEADSCTQGGGVWRPALGVCDRSAGGGGGY